MCSLREQQKLLVLVGTKTDLDPQQVSYEDGLTLSQEVGAQYFHLSTRNFEKVRQLFNYLGEQRLRPGMQGPMLTEGQTQNTSLQKVQYRLWSWLMACVRPRKED